MKIGSSTDFNCLSKKEKFIAKYINLHESDGSLANLRFAQDTITNWVPKAVFSRSVADFADMSFLELTENLLVYFGPAILGEKLFQKIYSHHLDKNLVNKISVRGENLLKFTSEKAISENKKLLPVKAAIAVASLAIPIAEYSLNYVKNILTLNIFKKADFNNIASLDKTKKEDTNKQEQVRKSAIKHLKIAGGIFSGCLAFATLLATRGKNSASLQKISEFILAPGNKIFKNNSKKAETFNKYLSIDFNSANVKDKFGKTTSHLALSKGQLMSCVLVGAVGYLGAAKDRGKQNFLEVLFRYPVVTFYVITGSEMFEKAFKNILNKTGKCKELLNEENLKGKMPKLGELPQLAKNLAVKKGTCYEEEFKKLFKQKSAIIGIPALFSLLVMGFFVAGYSRFFTQYRYNKEHNINKI